MGEKATAPLMGYLDAPFFADISRRTALCSSDIGIVSVEQARLLIDHVPCIPQRY